MSDIIRDGSIAGAIPSIPTFRRVSPDVFAERCDRLRALAPGHAMEEYLRFAAAICGAQDSVLQRMPDLALPDAKTIEHCREHGMPPLAAKGMRRSPAWLDALQAIAHALNADALPPQARTVVQRLASGTVEGLEVAADAVLSSEYELVDAGIAPFVGAALQVYWVKLALQLGDLAFAADAPYGTCPACASYPVAGAVRIGGAAQGLRYLVCSLCASEWHVVRVKCSACASTAGISYLGIEGAKDSVKAEVCAQCGTYLKLFYLEKDPAIVASADDLATLALDMLVFEQGYGRLGANLLLAPGSGT
jgi:FdhE protein